MSRSLWMRKLISPPSSLWLQFLGETKALCADYDESLISIWVGLVGCLRFCRQPFNPYSTLLPRAWAHSITAFGNALRDSHPSEVLSELLPLLESEAEQGYHCRRTISLRDGLPGPLLDRSNRYAPFRLRLMQNHSCTGGLGEPSSSLHRLLMLLCCRIFSFLRRKKSPHIRKR